MICIRIQAMISLMISWPQRIITLLYLILIVFFAERKLLYSMIVRWNGISWANLYFIIHDFFIQLLIVLWNNQWDYMSLIAWNSQEFCYYSIWMPRWKHYLADLCFNIFVRFYFKICFISCFIIHSHLEHHINEALSNHFKLKITKISSQKFLVFTYISLHGKGIIKAAID